nr:uncharacterized protein LOC109774284 [Aegilops tauschii subsp. strangulata]
MAAFPSSPAACAESAAAYTERAAASALSAAASAERASAAADRAAVAAKTAVAAAATTAVNAECARAAARAADVAGPEEQFEIFKVACDAEAAKEKLKYMKGLQERNMGCHHLRSRDYTGKRSIWSKEDAKRESLGIPDPLAELTVPQ